MARMKIYKNSVLASVVSIVGGLTLILGVTYAVQEEVLPGILIALAGFALYIWASVISDNKRFKTWKKTVEAKGLDDAARSSVQSAIQVYNTYPCDKTLKYIAALNPEAARNISAQLAAKKKK